jgi:glycosyltransferase involved in cell wall biosynthesis
MSLSVIIIQEHIPHYRVPFYQELRKLLDVEGICLEVVYSPLSSVNMIHGKISWAIPIRAYKMGPLKWQNVINKASKYNLVIVQQESKYLANVFLLILARIFRYKIAMWGHGRNFQSSSPNSISELLKRFLSRSVDWWFAYNNLSASVVKSIGYPVERITNVMNSIDTNYLQKKCISHDRVVLDKLKSELGISSDNIAIYSGSFYHEKRIDFLIESCQIIRATIPDFHLIVMGSGSQKNLIEDAALTNPWIKYIGTKGDDFKSPYWMISKIALMPGAIGLVILDSFVYGVPLITTSYPFHGPEIDYLVPGVNGIIVDDFSNTQAYAEAAIDLLRDEEKRLALATEARKSASLYTIEKMAQNFANGIMDALRR